jgi:hypothetical protein
MSLELASRIQAAMTYPYTDMCYTASEAYYHLSGGKNSGLTPVYMPEPVPSNQKHWALRQRDGTIIDLTAAQYGGLQPDYSKAKGCGFMTRHPSKAAQALIDKVTANLPRGCWWCRGDDDLCDGSECQK